MTLPVILLLAMALDALLGEPKWLWSRLPHPAVLMGRAVGWADTRYNQGPNRRQNGMLVMAGLALGALLLGAVLENLGWLVELIVAAILLAQRSLVDHVRDVARALRLSVHDGRLMVARIVGRDTAQMDAPAVSRAAIESTAENFSDGVIAPAFWFLVAGLPGLLLYKITNTADSMIGYRTDKYRDFGWAAARLDDVLNILPARLTALLIAIPHGALRHWTAITADARKHRSPNAGWPEAAMARAIDVALSGPRAYHGELRDYPFVNPKGRHAIGPDDILAATHALWVAYGVFAALVLAIALITC